MVPNIDTKLNGQMDMMMMHRLSQHPVCCISQGHPSAPLSKWRHRRQVRMGAQVAKTADDVHVHYMKEALMEARKAYVNQEVPVGAVLVCDNEIISRSGNMTEQTMDPTAHAEMICIRQAAAHNNGWRLKDCILYTTLEPCPMCAGAILQSRLTKVVYGTRSPLLGAAGSWMDMFHSSNDHPFHPSIEIVGGICELECCRLLKEFYRERRMQSPEKRKCS